MTNKVLNWWNRNMYVWNSETLNKKSSLFFNIGLIIAVVLCVIAWFVAVLSSGNIILAVSLFGAAMLSYGVSLGFSYGLRWSDEQLNK